MLIYLSRFCEGEKFAEAKHFYAWKGYDFDVLNGLDDEDLIQQGSRRSKSVYLTEAGKDGVPQPEYTINPGDIMIKFTAPVDRVIRVTVKVTDKEQTVLTLLAEDPGYTMPQLAERLGVSRKTVAARLKKLKEAGLIVRIGSDRKGYWKLLK